MYPYHNPRHRQSGNFLVLFLLGASFVLLLSVGGFLLYQHREAKREEERDLLRISQLRAEHSRIVVDMMALPPANKKRIELEDRLIDVTAEHNAILQRHPTWTIKPLDVKAIAK